MVIKIEIFSRVFGSYLLALSSLERQLLFRVPSSEVTPIVLKQSV